MADKMDVSLLETLLVNGIGGRHTLLVDCRPFLAYNLCHINSAHNIHCPPIVKRRSGGSLNLENIIRCPTTRAELLAGHFPTVIVYDECTDDLAQLCPDSNMALVLKSLTEDADLKGVHFLRGGFDYFSRLYPHLCEGSDSSCSSLSSSLSSTPSLQLSQGSSAGGFYSATDNSPQVPSASVCAFDTVKCNPANDQGDPVEILPHLFLGNAYHAAQENRLTHLGITALLNVSTSQDIHPPSAQFCYKRFFVDDDCVSDISCWFPEAIHFIEQCRETNKKVLVHCQAGISRSATICMAYLMWLKNWKLEQTFDFLKAKRKLISPNLNFMRQLLEFESELRHQQRGCEMLIGLESSVSSDETIVVTSGDTTGTLSPMITTSSASGMHQTLVDSRFSFEIQSPFPSCGAGGGGCGGAATMSNFRLLPPPSVHQPQPHSALLPLCRTADFASPGAQRPASARPTFNLPLTPCTTQAAVFSFDMPLTPHTPSPPHLHHASPLVSPS